MHKSETGLTLIEAIVMVAVVATLGVLVSIMIVPWREEARKRACANHLSQLTTAHYSYTQSYAEFYAFSWGPDYEGTTRRKDAMTSVAEFFPQYVNEDRIFRCPSDRGAFPHIATNIPSPVAQTIVLKRSSPDDFPELLIRDELPSEFAGLFGDYQWSNRNHTIINSSYGYDCRVYPSAVSNHAVFADMDGSGGPNQNHRGGQNVAYVDGHVAWVTTNFASNGPLDNIFTENDWSADTDSYISTNHRPGNRNGPADQYNDLTVSYDGYKNLHPY